MTTPTAEEMTMLRGAVEAWYHDSVDIYRITETEDVFGGSEESAEVKVAGPVACMLESGAAQEQMRALFSKLEGVQLFTAILPAGTDIRVNDHVIVTSRNNLHLRIQAVIAPESWEIERRAIGSELGEH